MQPSSEARLDASWQHFGLRALLLENDLLRIEVLPEAGAKVASIRYKPADRELLFQHPRIRPAAQPPGAGFDDTWSGGWDDMFPNAAAESWQGEPLHDHGELWTQRWEWEPTAAGPDEAGVHLWCYTPRTPARCDKWLTLRRGEPLLRARYRFTNLSARPLPFALALHPAVPASEHLRIDLPAGTMRLDEWDTDRFAAGLREYAWPWAQDRQGRALDMRRGLPAEAGASDLHYAMGLHAGWFALTDTRAQIGLGMVFPLEAFPCAYLFQSYGGWRGLNVAIVEPATSWPGTFSEAQAAGRTPQVAAGGAWDCQLLTVVYNGLCGVAHIGPDGSVLPAQDEAGATR